MSLGTLILWPAHTDIWRHLATEEWLLSQLAPRDAILYLWRAADAVVIGKHQNPWQECRPARLAGEGGCLARRVSGGGAVYHDLGNLNYSFLLPRPAYDRDQLAALVLRALQRLGLPAELGPRHVLRVGERKFSGNAFCLRRDGALHHGTLLVHADLDRLQGWLQPACPALQTKAVQSVRATVVNLAELQPALTPTSVGDALVAEFRASWPGAAACPLHPDPAVFGPAAGAAIAAHAARHATWEWRFGETPTFRLVLPATGPAALAAKVAPPFVEVEAGRVAHVMGGSDAEPAGHLVARLDAAWSGTIFQGAALQAATSAAGLDAAWPALAAWLTAPDW